MNEFNPFHQGEIEIQAKLGIAQRIAQVASSIIRPCLLIEHREFFRQLPMVVTGLVDQSGHPWCIPLFGRSGFIRSPNDKSLTINARSVLYEGLGLDYQTNSKIGLLGIQPFSRRRNRLNGVIGDISDDQLVVNVTQSYGNCPQYIQQRDLKVVSDADVTIPSSISLSDGLDEVAVQLITGVDTFFIASRSDTFTDADNSGIDASHRGGLPGFVKVENNRLYFPDFSGNRYFNTLGNILLDSRVGMWFPNFESGDSVFLIGRATILWEQADAMQVPGAERIIEVEVDQSVYLPNFLPLRGELMSLSPVLRRTGVWSPMV